jgi:hypothetical protein
MSLAIIRLGVALLTQVILWSGIDSSQQLCLTAGRRRTRHHFAGRKGEPLVINGSRIHLLLPKVVAIRRAKPPGPARYPPQGHIPASWRRGPTVCIQQRMRMLTKRGFSPCLGDAARSATVTRCGPALLLGEQARASGQGRITIKRKEPACARLLALEESES